MLYANHCVIIEKPFNDENQKGDDVLWHGQGKSLAE